MPSIKGDPAVRDTGQEFLVHDSIEGLEAELRVENDHENLMSELAKSLTRKDERADSQSKGTEKKILIPSHLRCGPVSHTTMLVNQFFID